MSAQLEVSVALCTHNGARFLAEQVRSILDQTELPAQVVLSDDASTDGSVEIVENMWAGLGIAAPSLTVLRNQSPLGVTGNFQQAVQACSSDLIALSDQDDVWAPDRIERMVARFDESPGLGLLFTDARLLDGAGVDLGASLFEALEVSDNDLSKIRRGEAFGVFLRRNLVTGATVIFRRSLLDQALPFDPAWVHDEWLAVIAAAVSEVDWLPEKLVDYRQHGCNEIGVTAPTLRYKVGRVLEPRGDRYSGLAERAEHLRTRLEALNVSPSILIAASGKLRHQKFREQLPSNRLARAVPVLREAAIGHYARFSSQGNLDVLRDLLQPDRREGSRSI